MNLMMRTASAAVAILVLLVGMAVSQPAIDQPPATKPVDGDDKKKELEKDAGADAKKAAGKDPTDPSQKLKDALNPPKYAAKPGAAPLKLPAIVLRGRVIAKGQPALALLEVDGKLVTVAKGSSFTAANWLQLSVTELTANEVRIEIAALKETVVLR